MAKKLKISLKYKFLGVLMFTLALGFSTFFALAYKTFSEDKKLFVMELNLSILKTAISDTRADLKSRIDELQVFLPKIYEPETLISHNLFRELSLQNLPQDLIGVKFYRRNINDSSFTLVKEFTNTELLESKSLPDKTLAEIDKNSPAPINNFSFASGTILLNRSLNLPTSSGNTEVSVLTLLIPGTFINDNTKSVIIVVDLLQDFLRKKLQQSELAEVFLVTKSGALLSHGSSSLLAQNTNKLFEHPIVEKLKTRQLPRESLELVVKNETYLCNLSESGINETYAVSQIKQSEAFAALKTLMKETLLTGIFILSIAMILSIIFSNRLTSNIKKLKEAAQTIGEKGKLDTALDIKSNDEIQNVAESFNQMSSEIQDLLIKTKENARMETELETAKILQSTLLSSNHVDTDAVQIEPFYLSASETGGDIWDVYLAGNILTVLVGDATGHGVPAAIVTAVAKSCFTTLNSIYPECPLSPELFLHQLNRVIYESCKEKLLMTMAVIQVNLHTGEAILSNAGHEAPLLLKAPTPDNPKSKSEALFIRGERLGFSPNSIFERLTTQFNVGDTLLIYTDGISEAVNTEGKQFGERALKKLFNRLGSDPLPEIKNQIISELKEFMGSAPQMDDITYVLFKWNKIMEKISIQPSKAPIPVTIVPPIRQFEEIDYSEPYGEQLDIEALEFKNTKLTYPIANPEGVELASEWNGYNSVEPSPTHSNPSQLESMTETHSIDEGVRSVIILPAPLQLEPLPKILLIDQGVRSVISLPASLPQKKMPISQLIELAKSSDFTEEEVDTHYAKLEETKDPKQGSSDDEAA